MNYSTRKLSDVEQGINEAFADICEFYKHHIIKTEAFVYDCGKKVMVTDYIAEQMLKSSAFDGIGQVLPRDLTENLEYIVPQHRGKGIDMTKTCTKSQEMLFAYAMYKRGMYENSPIDYFADYQTPILRDTKRTGVKSYGKIDLVGVCHKKKEIYLCELKTYHSTETLLRCVAEIYTYKKQIDCAKLAGEIEGCQDYEIIPAVLVFKNKFQHMQYIDQSHANVRALMKKWGVRMFVIDTKDAPVGADGRLVLSNREDIVKIGLKCSMEDVTNED